jgi:hypothetical protein
MEVGDLLPWAGAIITHLLLRSCDYVCRFACFGPVGFGAWLLENRNSTPWGAMVHLSMPTPEAKHAVQRE